MDLKEKVKNLTSYPGVYLMKDSLGGVLYVGKAKNLKRRVQSYFQSSKPHSPKVEKLVKHLIDFDYIVTDTEFEAFMLECSLIQKLKPIYNKQMKSPLSYTYIVIRRDYSSPVIEVATDPIDDGCSQSFGPYVNKSTVEKAVQKIRECFKIPCSRPYKKNTSCLNYSLGLCIGMCLGGSADLEYRDIIDKLAALLDGTDYSLLEEMEQSMNSASGRFNFEGVARYRDCIDVLNRLVKNERIIGFTEENKNIAVTERLEDNAFKLFLIKGSRLLFSEKNRQDEVDSRQLCSLIKSNIIKYFANEPQSSSAEVTRYELDEARIIYSYLKSSNSSYVVIPGQWLCSGDDTAIDEAVEELLR
jgi:excinuclease ABC subunit C